ncbi:hypothetical protein SPOG_01524 [Schizosaccharomyces cryophilus OY26]|uniref:Uncharacterized protein n=1 Tax=Schizosaccharomyces cryophilus (strain OY26 / ATCC MYA-4695 / CBS 11777 / NBRC 106824 / NRRL Y48691) TaxID=653667 RepID=S9VNU4_SCHCR|nr:uncharacterized protein SPOG_01524 [Schizosaccharomyces cryophilus OY26]EPY49643.1 hypothetical protein SPOG_01524 [Schizosaccharomyces cryophilus OY26]
MLQPRVMWRYRLPEDDSGDTYEKISQELTKVNKRQVLAACCIFFICFTHIVLASTLKYHGKAHLVIWLYFAIPIILVLTFPGVGSENCTRLPKKEKERRDREQQLSNAGTNGPSNLHPHPHLHPQENQSLPQYTETNETKE